MKIEYIKYGNLEELGKIYFYEGIEYALNKEYAKACVFFKEALNYITYDCYFYFWDKKYEVKDIFDDTAIGKESSLDYYFVKAFLLCYTGSVNKQNQYLALDAANRYLKIISDEYMIYILCLIHIQLDENVDEQYNNLVKLSINYDKSRLNYVVGKMGKRHGSADWLDKFYKAFIANPSSSFSAMQLHLAIFSKQLKIDIFPEFSENPLVIDFLKFKDLFYFEELYKAAFENQASNPKDLLNVKEFYKFIELNSHVFLQSEIFNVKDFIVNHYDLDDNEEYSSIYNNDYYNDSLDMDQQSPEFWDNL